MADSTHEQLRMMLGSHDPIESAGQLLDRGHAPMNVLHALVTEKTMEGIDKLDVIVREKVDGPLPASYEAYVALMQAKVSAPPHVLDRDAHAVRVVEDMGIERGAIGEALPHVLDLPHPDADRHAVARLLLTSVEPSPAPPERSPLPGFLAVTPLVAREERTVGEGSSEPPGRALDAQLAALDADRHQVVVRGLDGTVQYLAPEREGTGFVSTERPTWLTNDQVRTAWPTMEGLGRTVNLDLVSESARHHYVVLDGLDARQARELDDHFGANLVLRVGDEHMAVVRLTDEPERALRVASLLRARYPSGPDLPASSEGRPTLGSREGVELVSARSEDVLPSVSERSERRDSPALAVERFADYRIEAERSFLRAGLSVEPEKLDAFAARRMLVEGYREQRVVDAVQFASPRLEERQADGEVYARRVVDAVRQAPVEGREQASKSSPDVGGL